MGVLFVLLPKSVISCRSHTGTLNEARPEVAAEFSDIG